MKVYITTSGCYSDFQIRHVFLTEELARAEADTLGEGDWDEYEVRDKPVEYRQWHTLTWWPHLDDREGDYTASANPFEYEHRTEYDPSEKLSHHWITAIGYTPRDVLKVEGWDKQDVLKVYSEQRAMFLARREGIA